MLSCELVVFPAWGRVWSWGKRLIRHMLDCAGAPQKYCVKASCGVNDLELSVTAGGDEVQAPTV